jgi:hypothetical protein
MGKLDKYPASPCSFCCEIQRLLALTFQLFFLQFFREATNAFVCNASTILDITSKPTIKIPIS